MEATPIEKRENESIVQTERARGGRSYVPAVDIVESEQELLVLADVPGARAEDIDVNFENGVLTLHASVEPRETEPGRRSILREYGVGDFHRSFQIGDTVDAGKISAEVSHGVLTLHLPKTEAVKPRKISVRGAD